jgi:spore germination protein GerM
MDIKAQFLKRSLIYASLAILCGITAYWVFVINTVQPPVEEKSMPISRSPVMQAPLRSEAHLYFSNKENAFLNSETTVLQHTEAPGQFAKKIVHALIEGPKNGLIPTIPESTALNALYVTSDRTAFVDLSEDVSEAHSGGCQSEVMTVFSIVNSLILNVPEIDKVKILVEGKEAETLAGHIDLRLPFTANMLLVR